MEHIIENYFLSFLISISSFYCLFLKYIKFNKCVISKYVVLVWNIFLSIFSITGSIVTNYNLYQLKNESLNIVICDHKNEWFSSTTNMGIAIILFTMSKPLELIDTILLKLRSRKITFLHAYHHLSVMWYTWHAFLVRSSPGIIFAVMNYNVHAIMYSYYAITQFTEIPKKWSFLITCIQILQMMLGMIVSIYALMSQECDNSSWNTYFALLMYTSYFYLFVSFFINIKVKKYKKI